MNLITHVLLSLEILANRMAAVPRRLPAICILVSMLIPSWGWAGTTSTNVVAPANMANEDSFLGSGTLRNSLRIQLAYGARHFSSSGMIITELRFRPDYFFGHYFSTHLKGIQIRLSTTSRDPEKLSKYFTENIGPDETVVFNGSVTVSSAFTGPDNGPKDFDIVIPLTTPFVYGPALGNLLVDIRNFYGSAASPLSGQSRTDDAAGRVFSGDVNSISGKADNGVDALRFTYIPTNGPPLPAPKVSRGPYLQSGTSSNILVRWHTDLTTDSRVRFGLDPGALSWSVRDGEHSTTHSLTLTNLRPNTKYFYNVGTSETSLVDGAEYYFHTAPTNAASTRIWAVSDFGTTGTSYGWDENAIGVRDAYLAYTGSRHTDVWLSMGDNSQGEGTDAEYQSQVFDVYPMLLRNTVLWPTIGNHDALHYPASFDYANVFSPPTEGEAGGVASYSKHFYSFDYANIHFICLDAATASPSTNTAMLTWLERDLSANTKDWLIAFWHTPPYTFGTHNSDSLDDTSGYLVQMREVVLPMLEAHGVDLVLCGHSHVYERSYLLDGHHRYSRMLQPTMIKDSGSGRPDDTGAYKKTLLGPTPHEGTVYVVAGVGGWLTPLVPGLPDLHPAMFIKIRERGSLVIDVNTNRLDASFLRETGVIGDHFTIIKGGEPDPLRLVTSRVVGSQVVELQWKSIPGKRYTIEQTDDLENFNSFKNCKWQAVGSDILATGATTRWTNALPAGRMGFYQVKLVDP